MKHGEKYTGKHIADSAHSLNDGLNEHDVKNEQTKKYKHVIWRLLFYGMAAVMVACLLFGLLYYNAIIEPQASLTVSRVKAEKDSESMHTELYYLDSDLNEWVLLETLYAGEQNAWISYKNIPVNVRNAAVAIEDKRFWEHKGIDPYRICGAIVHTVRNKLRGHGGMEGGSTITQQLIKNVSGNDQITVRRKIIEMFSAMLLEQSLTKEEILEMYLNEIYFGYSCRGIYEASYRYFNKDVHDLDIAESALLVGITNNPSLYNPYQYPKNSCSRAKLIIQAMYHQGYISEDECEKAVAEVGFVKHVDDTGSVSYVYSEEDATIVFDDGSLSAIIKNGGTATDNKYEWFTDAVIESLIDDLGQQGYTRRDAVNYIYNGGLNVYTTYNPKVQSAVDSVCLDHYDDYGSEDGQDLQTGIVVIDNETGGVAAIAGGLGEKQGNRLWNRAVDSSLPPASAIKPLSVYIPALEAGVVTLSSKVSDEPVKKVDGKDWPTNESGEYSGMISIQDAVAYSINTVPVTLLDTIGLDVSYDWLTQKFHLEGLVDKDKNEAPLALGGLTYGTSVLDMAAAYATLPRDGVYVKPYYYTAVEDYAGDVIVEHSADDTREQVYSKKTANSMEMLLQCVVEYGTGTEAAIPGVDCYGKTGTSNDDKDLWFCGYTKDYTAAVWCGYDDPTTIVVPAEDSIAAVIWQKVMAQIVSQQRG